MLASYVSFTCHLYVLFVWYVLAKWSILITLHVFLWFVSTPCGFFPLCVAKISNLFQFFIILLTFCQCHDHYLCVYFLILVMYILVLFLVVYQSRNVFYILYTYFFVDITANFSFYQLCEFYPWLDENFWGCMHMCFTICSYMCILKYVYLI